MAIYKLTELKDYLAAKGLNNNHIIVKINGVVTVRLDHYFVNVRKVERELQNEVAIGIMVVVYKLTFRQWLSYVFEELQSL